MAKPRLFLVPQWAPAEWTIQPWLREWAEVASYDYARAIEQGAVTRELFVDAGLARVDELGWERFFVVGDTFGTGTAARIARERRERVQGVALGHASLSYGMDGERPVVNRELWAAMSQLISQDAGSFIRYGITQLTQGGYDEDVAQQMVDRVPAGQMQAAWNLIRDEQEPIGEMLREIDRPLLLAKHVGCLMFTDAGFEDACAAFPHARVAITERPPSADVGFAEILREFCRTS